MNYYLGYKNRDNLQDYLSFISMLGEKVSSYIHPESPFLLGDWEKDYNKKLRDLHLSDFGMNKETLAEYMADYFKGVIRWHYPLAFHNIKTPINIYAAAVSALSMLYDANLAEDKNCGNMASAELEVIKYLSEAAGWDAKNSGGYFTFGGTSTLLNAVKIGINKALPNASKTGIKEDVFIVCSEQEHHSINKVCNWLGIGKENCIMMPTDDNYQFDVVRAEEIITKQILNNRKLVAIIACGGTTVQKIIDPIKMIKDMRDRIISQLNLNYCPHLHVDSVISWPLLFFNGYSFIENPLNIKKDVINAVESIYLKLKDIRYADSFGADFHKTGFCPFASSTLVTKNKSDLLTLNGELDLDYQTIGFGQYNTTDYVLECSRSLSGVMSALAVLKLLGKNGIRSEFASITVTDLKIRSMLSQLDDFEIINPVTFGIDILFIVKSEKCKFDYKDLPYISQTKAFRLANYNYNFYLYCLKHMADEHIALDYSSGYEKGKNGVFMGVLKLQSFSPMLDDQNIEQLIQSLQKLKREYDNNPNAIEMVDMPYEPKSLKFAINTSDTKNKRWNWDSSY